MSTARVVLLRTINFFVTLVMVVLKGSLSIEKTSSPIVNSWVWRSLVTTQTEIHVLVVSISSPL